MVRARKQTITSLFCSLQQVLVALWNSADENDFLEMIKEWIYCQDKTLDPYRQNLSVRDNKTGGNAIKLVVRSFVR